MNRKNNVRLEGNLIGDPKINQFNRLDKDGKERENTVANFRIACDGGRDGHSDEVYYASCECWDSSAHRIAEFRKGDAIYVEGCLRNKEWVDKKTNEKRFDTIIRVTHFIPVFIKSDVVTN